jgi:hypothetical protein
LAEGEKYARLQKLKSNNKQKKTGQGKIEKGMR